MQDHLFTRNGAGFEGLKLSCATVVKFPVYADGLNSRNRSNLHMRGEKSETFIFRLFFFRLALQRSLPAAPGWSICQPKCAHWGPFPLSETTSWWFQSIMLLHSSGFRTERRRSTKVLLPNNVKIIWCGFHNIGIFHSGLEWSSLARLSKEL